MYLKLVLTTKQGKLRFKQLKQNMVRKKKKESPELSRIDNIVLQCIKGNHGFFDIRDIKRNFLRFKILKVLKRSWRIHESLKRLIPYIEKEEFEERLYELKTAKWKPRIYFYGTDEEFEKKNKRDYEILT